MHAIASIRNPSFGPIPPTRKSLRLPGLTTPTLRCPNSSKSLSPSSFRHRRLPGSHTLPPINVTVTPEKPITLLSAACSLQAWRGSPTDPRQPHSPNFSAAGSQPITSGRPCISCSRRSNCPICTSCSPPKRSPCENSLPRSFAPGSIDAHSAARLASLPAARLGSLPPFRRRQAGPAATKCRVPLAGVPSQAALERGSGAAHTAQRPAFALPRREPDRKDVNGGVDIRDWSAGSAAVGFRPARKVPGADASESSGRCKVAGG